MSVSTILAFAAAASTMTPPVTGDFDGDGAADTAAIISKADGTHEVLVRFAGGQSALVARVEDQAELAVVTPDRIDALCEPIVSYMPDCTRRLAGRDREAVWIKHISGSAQGLAVWNGTRFRVVTSLWPENAASAGTNGGSGYSNRTAPSREVRSVVELDVSSAGKADACRVVQSSGVPQLDTEACSIMLQKAKLRPASGTGVGRRAATRTAIVWRVTE